MRFAPTLFLALELPSSLRRGLAPLLAQLAAIDPAVRPAPPEALHLTLRFLGRVEPLAQSLLRATASQVAQRTAAFRLSFQGLGTFSEGAQPRVIWAGVGEGQPEVRRLAEALADALAEVGWPPESRPFRAHCTLARVAEGCPVSSAVAVAELCRRELAEAPLVMWAETLALLESVPVPEGPNAYPRLAGWRFQAT